MQRKNIDSDLMKIEVSQRDKIRYSPFRSYDNHIFTWRENRTN